MLRIHFRKLTFLRQNGSLSSRTLNCFRFLLPFWTYVWGHCVFCSLERMNSVPASPSHFPFDAGSFPATPVREKQTLVFRYLKNLRLVSRTANERYSRSTAVEFWCQLSRSLLVWRTCRNSPAIMALAVVLRHLEHLIITNVYCHSELELLPQHQGSLQTLRVSERTMVVKHWHSCRQVAQRRPRRLPEGKGRISSSQRPDKVW